MKRITITTTPIWRSNSNMKYPAKIIIATGTFMNITVELEIDTENIEESKAVIQALHKHFYGLLDENTKKD